MEKIVLLTCPHCENEHSTIESQRCPNCKMNMMSDREFALISQTAHPLATSLASEIEAMKSNGLNKTSWLEVQRLVKELAPYQNQSPIVSEWIGKLNKELEPFWDEMDVIKKTIYINLLILFILALIPVMAWLFGGDETLISMLFLPVLGWGWFGFRGYLKKQKVI